MKKIRIILGCVQIFIAIGALPAGYGMLADPTGEGLGMSTVLLNDSPLDSFFIPGLYLLIINGLGSVAGAILSFAGIRFAGIAGLILGILLCTWIMVQVWWIGLISALQPVFLLIGIAEAWLGWKIRK